MICKFCNKNKVKLDELITKMIIGSRNCNSICKVLFRTRVEMKIPKFLRNLTRKQLVVAGGVLLVGVVVLVVTVTILTGFIVFLNQILKC